MMTYLFFGFIFGFWVGFFVFLRKEPVVLTCIHCRKSYLQNPYSGEFCNALCAGIYLQKLSDLNIDVGSKAE